MEHRPLLRRLSAEDHGATAAEYAIMVFLIAVAIVVAVTALGDTLNGLFESVAEAIADMLS